MSPNTSYRIEYFNKEYNLWFFKGLFDSEIKAKEFFHKQFELNNQLQYRLIETKQEIIDSLP